MSHDITPEDIAELIVTRANLIHTNMVEETGLILLQYDSVPLIANSDTWEIGNLGYCIRGITRTMRDGELTGVNIWFKPESARQ